MSAPRSLDDCLDHADAAARVLTHARTLVRLGQLYETICPGQLARASRVVNAKSGKIIIHADHGAVAAKLRQIADSLRSGFLDKGVECIGIDIRVQPRQPGLAPALIAANKPGLSRAGREHLGRLAASLDGRSPLRQALERLADRPDED